MRTVFLTAAIAPVFVWALGLFVILVLASSLGDFIGTSLTGGARPYRPVRRRHALF